MYSYYNQPKTTGDDLKIVNGYASAEQYLMYPNSRVILMDSTQDRFYLKETDAAGVSRIRTYDFVEVVESNKNDYVTRQELEELMKKYELNFKQQQPEQKFSSTNEF